MDDLNERENSLNPAETHEKNIVKPKQDASSGMSDGSNAQQSKSGLDLNSRESGFYSPTDSGGGMLSKFSKNNTSGKGIASWSRRKKIGVAGAGGGSIVAVLVVSFLLSIFAGSSQQIQLGNILKRSFNPEEEASKSRFERFLSGEEEPTPGTERTTNLQKIGNKIFGDPGEQLSDAGISFSTDANDHITGLKIDPSKLSNLSEIDPNLNTPAEITTYLSEKLGIPESSFPSGFRISMASSPAVSSSTFDVNLENSSIGALRIVQKNALSILGDGKIVSFIKARTLASFFETPSLFHPFERAKAKAKQGVPDAVAEVEEENADTLKTQEADPTLKSSLDSLKNAENSHSIGNLVGAALVLTQVVCIIRDVSASLVEVDRMGVAVPSATNATRQMAMGDQIEAGKDVSISQINAKAASTVDYSSGKPQTLFAAKSLQVLEGDRKVTGVEADDMPASYRAGFRQNVTANNLMSWFGFGLAGKAACSTVGQVIQGVYSLAILASGLFDVGASDVAFVGVKASIDTLSDEGLHALEFNFVMAAIKSFSVKLLENKSIVPHLMQGALGGNILAYGSREAANTAARASGGIMLTAAQSALLNNEANKADQANFSHQSFFARTMNIYDYRSPLGKMAQAFTPSFTQNLGIIFNQFVSAVNLSNLFSKVASVFSLSAKADSQDTTDPNNYYWGFEQYGIPQSMLDDPTMDNPYKNASDVYNILDRNSSTSNEYISRAENCFGVTISNGSDGWDVTTKDIVGGINTNDPNYPSNCGDTSDSDWKKIIMWIFDSRTMNAVDCYNGGDTSSASCSNIGASQ